MKILGRTILAAIVLSLVGAFAYGQNPPAPTDLSAKLVPPSWGEDHDFSAGVILTWHDSLGTPHLSFRVYRSLDDTTSFAKEASSTSQGYFDHDVQTGHTYYYYVTAVLSLGDTLTFESSRSNIASAQVLSPQAPPKGMIVGRVTDSLSGSPIAHALIRFFRFGKEFEDGHGTYSDSAGKYEATLDTGTYLIDCRPLSLDRMMTPVAPYAGKWYKDALEPSQATPVVVADSQSYEADFALVHLVIPQPVHVRGTVRDSAGSPLGGALVLFLRTVQEMTQTSILEGDGPFAPDGTYDLDDLGCIRGVMGKVWTDSSGAYEATILTAKPYVALAEKKGYVAQFYDHKAQPADATIIVVSGDTSGFDFNLNLFRPPQRYSISGTVRDSSGNKVPSRIVVFPLRPHPEHGVRFASTDSLGDFTVTKILAGRYILKAIPYGTYAPAYYKAGAFGVIHWMDADTVTVNSNVTGIDIGVDSIGSAGMATVHGKVSSGGAGLPGIDVYAQMSDGSIGGYTLTDNAGAYEIDGLPAGPLTLIVDGEGFTSGAQSLSIAPSVYSLAQSFAVEVATTVPPASATHLPQAYELGQNYPNPFNPTTTIRFGLPVASAVSIRIYNLLGQQIVTLLAAQLGAGEHQAVWDGRDSQGRAVASGVYFYRMEATSAAGDASFSQMKRMLLIK